MGKSEVLNFLCSIGLEIKNFPIRLDEILNRIGYKVYTLDKKEAPDGFAGAVDYARKAIFVNASDPYARQRFTIAHEIAHAHLHEGSSRIDYRNDFWDEKEKEANQFAAELLMPKSYFEVAWRRSNGSLPALTELFGVSSEAVTYRAKNLGLID